MPLYEYYCPRCSSKYELLRPMSESDAPGTCPKGHAGGQRTLSMFAAVAKGSDGASLPMDMGGGGCACGGGGCGCGR